MEENIRNHNNSPYPESTLHFKTTINFSLWAHWGRDSHLLQLVQRAAQQGAALPVGGSYHHTNIGAILIITSESAALSCHFQVAGSEPSKEQGSEGGPGAQPGQHRVSCKDLSCGPTSSKASRHNPTASCPGFSPRFGCSLQKAMPACSEQIQLVGKSGVTNTRLTSSSTPMLKGGGEKKRDSFHSRAEVSVVNEDNLPGYKWIEHNFLLYLNVSLHCFHFGVNVCIPMKLFSLYSRVKLKIQA